MCGENGGIPKCGSMAVAGNRPLRAYTIVTVRRTAFPSMAMPAPTYSVQNHAKTVDIFKMLTVVDTIRTSRHDTGKGLSSGAVLDAIVVGAANCR